MSKLTVSLLFLLAGSALADCSTSDVLMELRPGAQWAMMNQDPKKIQWLDKTQSRPTTSQITRAMKDCVARRTAKEKEVRDAKIVAFDKSRSEKERMDAMAKLLAIYAK